MGSTLLAIGAINTDLVATMERAPDAGETITAETFAIFAGGKGANQAVSAARNGAQVAMLGALGQDANGEDRHGDLEAEGIATDWIYRETGAPSGVALIFVDTRGENRIAYVPGATLLVPVEYCLQAFEAISPGVVLATNELPPECLAAVFREAREKACTVIFNAAPDAGQSVSLLSSVDMLIVNEGELWAILGRPAADNVWIDQLQEVRAMGPEVVVVTRGSRGAMAIGPDGELCQVDPPRVEAVDSTGAGDAFCGAFAAAISRGETLAVALRYGVWAGSIATTIPGAQQSSPTLETIEARFHQLD